MTVRQLKVTLVASPLIAIAVGCASYNARLQDVESGQRLDARLVRVIFFS